MFILPSLDGRPPVLPITQMVSGAPPTHKLVKVSNNPELFAVLGDVLVL